MNKQPSCHDESEPGTLSFEQAQQRILESVKAKRIQRNVSIRESLNQVLAQDVESPMHVPPFINSAMDGYAIRSQDLPTSGETTLTVIGKSFAGAPFDGSVKTGEAVRIMTGAVLPEGANTVIMQEHAQVSADRIQIGSEHKAGQNVRHPGDDFKQGETILSAGERLTPARLGLLASVGVTEFKVVQAPVIAFFSTGDELKGVGHSLQPGEIYDSNRYTLYGMIRNMDVYAIDMGVLPDNREQIRQALEEAAQTADVVISSGGASVGEADYIKQILDEIGQVNFWKIAMKPGKPLAFGQIGKALFFGLPGNPVSAMATFYQFVQPAVALLQRETPTQAQIFNAICQSSIKKHPGRKDFQRGIATINAQGEWEVSSTGGQGSHMLSSMCKANCFIVLDQESGDISAGNTVKIQLFNRLI